MKQFWDYLFREWFRQVGEALLIAFLVTGFIFTTVGVFGSSMDSSAPFRDSPSQLPSRAESLRNAERVFVPKYETWLARFGLMNWKRGEVVIVKPPEDAPAAWAQFPYLGFKFRAYFIKRLVAIPGDTVSVREGVVFLNGKALNEVHIDQNIGDLRAKDNYPTVCYSEGKLVSVQTQSSLTAPEHADRYLKPTLEMLDPPSSKTLEASKSTKICEVGQIRLAKGYFFVMGDNRSAGGSEDSRTLGPIASNTIAGRATAVWFPFDRIRGLRIPQGFKDIQK